MIGTLLVYIILINILLVIYGLATVEDFTRKYPQNQKNEKHKSVPVSRSEQLFIVSQRPEMHIWSFQVFNGLAQLTSYLAPSISLSPRSEIITHFSLMRERSE